MKKKNDNPSLYIAECLNILNTLYTLTILAKIGFISKYDQQKLEHRKRYNWSYYSSLKKNDKHFFKRFIVQEREMYCNLES